jgi:hypothetical protein
VFVASIVPNECINRYPITSITTHGGGQSPSVNATLAVTFTGHITGYTNTSVSLCPGTVAYWEAVTTVGLPNCALSTGAVAVPSHVMAGDKLICTNKPAGGDTDRFRILTGP